MKKKVLIGLNCGTIAIAGSLLLASCSSPPPSQTTTITVEAPATPNTKSGSEETEIADLRTSNAIDADEPAAKTNAEPTARDVEDPVPARKSNAEPTNRDAEDPARKSASSSKLKSQLLDFYDRLPAKHFAAFGGVNRRSLLKRKGAIVDNKHNFIEIPGSADERDGDLRLLQITLFPNGKEPWCAVSRIVWPQGQTPGALNFYYGYSDDFDQHPRTAAAGFFPYKLQRTRDGSYESAWLPRRGLDIRINSAQDAELNRPIFRYNRNFGVDEPAFKEVIPAEEG